MDTIIIVIAIVVVIGMFTDFYGLGSIWSNRGSWYLVKPDELETVMSNLSELNAFKDSDGISQECIKIKAYYIYDTHYYEVKVPNWVFKYKQQRLTDEAKASMLGVKLR